MLAPAADHSYEAVVTKPTCTKLGYTTYTCSACGSSYKSDYVEMLGHDYTAVITAPTCTEGGYTTYTCTRCGDSYVGDYTDPLGHEWNEPVTLADSTCNSEGVLEYDCARCDAHYHEAISATGHKSADLQGLRRCADPRNGPPFQGRRDAADLHGTGLYHLYLHRLRRELQE